MTKKYLFLYSLLIIGKSVFTQNVSIKGQVRSEAGDLLSFVNILLLQPSDSSIVQATVTDTTGTYRFGENIPESFILKGQYIGYETYHSEVISLVGETGNKTFNIELVTSKTTMNEVAIIATKPLVEHQLDKIIVNVENSIAAAGNNALELLEKSPGVIVNHQNESISILNRSGVIFYINNRQTYMSGSDLMQYLRNLSSAQISRIEIITNPSSKYDAAGNAGIINIILLKNQAWGTNGTITGSIGQAFLPEVSSDLTRGILSASVNHRSEKFYLFASLSTVRDGFYSENNIKRSFDFNNIESTMEQKVRSEQSSRNYNVRLGADYSLSAKTTIGIVSDMNISNLKIEGRNSTRSVSNTLIPDGDFFIEQPVHQDVPRFNIGTNLNLTHNFNSKGKKLSFDIDYLDYSMHAEQNFNATFYNAGFHPQNELIQLSNNSSNLNVLAAKADMEIPLNETTGVDFGVKSSFVKIDSELKFQELQNDYWIIDTTKSNHFIYDENINAAYINFKKIYSKLSFQTGLRAEQTNSKGNSITLDSIVHRNYISLFPTAFITYKTGENSAMKLSVSRRLDRPGYNQLNPFIIVLDPYSYATGNPYLQPQFTYSSELAYYYKSYSLTLNYSRTDGLITELTIPNDSTKITRTMNVNLNYVDNFSASFNANLNVKNKWHIYSQVILYNKRFKDTDLLDGQLDLSQWMCYANVQNVFILPKKWSVELSGWYHSPLVEGIVIVRNHRFSVNTGIQKTLLSDRAKLKLNVSDIFLSSFVDGYVDYQNVKLTFQPRNASRRVMLTFSYNFGSQTVKASQRNKFASDSEKERIDK